MTDRDLLFGNDDLPLLTDAAAPIIPLLETSARTSLGTSIDTATTWHSAPTPVNIHYNRSSAAIQLRFPLPTTMYSFYLIQQSGGLLSPIRFKPLSCFDFLLPR
uniref:Uncharacterized protein n=1 Tax=Ditylum brightwellii TaxID=49249 RepID=A0A7S2EED2_9STRA